MTNYRIPATTHDVMPRLLDALRARTGSARILIYQGLVRALRNGLRDEATARGITGLRFASSLSDRRRLVQIARQQPVGVQIVIAHVWDEDYTQRVTENGHTLIVVDPFADTVFRCHRGMATWYPLSDGLPIHEFGFSTVDYAALVATDLGKDLS